MQTSPLDADRALPEFDLLPVTVRDNLLTLGGADTELSMGVIKVFWLPMYRYTGVAEASTPLVDRSTRNKQECDTLDYWFGGKIVKFGKR